MGEYLQLVGKEKSLLQRASQNHIPGGCLDTYTDVKIKNRNRNHSEMQQPCTRKWHHPPVLKICWQFNTTAHACVTPDGQCKSISQMHAFAYLCLQRWFKNTFKPSSIMNNPNEKGKILSTAAQKNILIMPTKKRKQQNRHTMLQHKQTHVSDPRPTTPPPPANYSPPALSQIVGMPPEEIP